MKKLFRPFQEAMHQSYEKMTFYRTPRGRSRKIRKYEHIDISKEFDFRDTQREMRKQRVLEDLYSKHDLEALGLNDLVPSNVDRSKMSEDEIKALEVQEDAQKQLLLKLKEDRNSVIAEFDDNTDTR